MKTHATAFQVVGWVAVLLVLAGGGARAASVTLVAGTASVGVGAEVSVPVLAEGAQKMGALMLDLTYDPAVLEALELDEFQDEDLAAGAAVEANLVAPGRWRVALARSEAIEGKGDLLRFKFRTLAEGQSAVALENVQAWDQTVPPLDMLVKLEDGSVRVAAAGLPVWAYAVAGIAALAILLLVGKSVRSKKA